jgi:hypothetical protein
LTKLITSPTTKAKLIKKPTMGTQYGKTVTFSGFGSVFLILHSAKFTVANTVKIIIDVASASEASRPVKAKPIPN